MERVALGVGTLLVAVLSVAPSCRQAGAPAIDDPQGGTAGSGETAEEATTDPRLLLGERIYREGLLGPGRPVVGTVAGDVQLTGSQVRCKNCHQASGLGSTEGESVAPMVTGAALYQPKAVGPAARPAYDDATLARSIREGVDSSGRKLNPLMPRYALEKEEMAALIAYLRDLSSRASPGVTPHDVHFATVVVEGIDPQPMLAVLERFFTEKNNEMRNPIGRRRSGAFYRRNVDKAYRKWRLHTWKLQGPPETWGGQLEGYYDRQPVFAFISGIARGSWAPIHEFCKSKGIPCMLPNCDYPALAPEGARTVYFSEGLHLEARTMAAHIARYLPDASVLQVVRAGSAAAQAAVPRTFEKAVSKGGGSIAITAAIPDGADLVEGIYEIEPEPEKFDVALLWLEPADIEALSGWLVKRPSRPVVYASATLIGEEPSAIPQTIRPRTRIAYPYTSGEEFEIRFKRAELWMRARGIAITDRRLQAQTYYACMLTAEALMHGRYDFWYRDFFLESIDHLSDRSGFFCAPYPHPTFGPGQRYLSKGCFMLTPGAGEEGGYFREWIVPKE